MLSFEGPLQKLSITIDTPAQYTLKLGPQCISLNPLIGSSICLRFSGIIVCQRCEQKTKTSFQQGYCFKCFQRLQECNLCVIHPERCQVELDSSCKPEDWAHAHCHGKHLVYLANSSGLKVGITREKQGVTRWLDQGAVQALPIFLTQNRYQAGQIELMCKAYLADKTHWQKMLKSQPEPVDLLQAQKQISQSIAKPLQQLQSFYQQETITSLTQAPLELTYPISSYPKTIRSLSFDKTAHIQGVLQGLKGQYLMLDTGVINIRKFTGYICIFESS